MCNVLQNCIVGNNAFWVIVHDGKLIVNQDILNRRVESNFHERHLY